MHNVYNCSEVENKIITGIIGCKLIITGPAERVTSKALFPQLVSKYSTVDLISFTLPFLSQCVVNNNAWPPCHSEAYIGVYCIRIVGSSL